MAFLEEEITNYLGKKVPVGTLLHYLDKHVGLILDQAAGPKTAQGANFPGWDQLGGRTVVDALAAIGAELGIEGFRVPNTDEGESKK